jgi:hypothetical protein
MNCEQAIITSRGSSTRGGKILEEYTKNYNVSRALGKGVTTNTLSYSYRSVNKPAQDSK